MVGGASTCWKRRSPGLGAFNSNLAFVLSCVSPGGVVTVTLKSESLSAATVGGVVYEEATAPEIGVPFSGAVASSYTTPPTVAADNDSLFSVTVTTPPGLTQESTKARLLLNAPKPGDLRFQQVDAPPTIDGYSSVLSENVTG